MAVKGVSMALTRPGAAQLRDYQRAAVDAADPAVERAVWVSGCGTGKTLMASAATAKLLAGRCGSVLILFPTLGLLEQTYRAWRDQFPRPFAALAVCSDTIGGFEDEDIDSEDLSVPNTTSPETLAQWLTESASVRVVFATYQSLSVITAAHQQFGAGTWTVAVCDEAHRTAGLHGKPFAAILDQRFVPADHRLFFTATPREHTGPRPRSRRSVASMDDQELYGHRAFTLSTREAIERGILADFKVAVIAVSDSAVGAALRDVRLISLAAGDDGHARADHVAASIALTQAAADYDLSSVLAFHNTIAASKEFAGTFTRTHALLTARGLTRDGRSANVTHIDGTSKLPARLAAVETLSRHDPDQWNVVTNARALTEGINIPSLDAVLFAEPRSSEVDVAQAVGRAIRKSPYHDRPSLIILSVTVDDTQDAENAIDISHFKRARQVLAALESHDPSIRKDLTRVRAALKDDPPIGDDSGSVRTDLLDIHLPADLPPHLAEQFLRAFSIHTVDTLTAQWEEALARLHRFVTDQGHSRPPQDYLSPDGFPLGRWVSEQRKRHSYGRLVRDRADRLQVLRGWAWNALDARWEENFAALASYADEHGHAYPPRGYNAPTQANLNQWVIGLRRPGVRDKLSEERRKRLEDLPGWSWDQRHKPAWEPSFAALVEYAESHGHAAPAFDYVSPAGVPLGEWVAALRVPSRKEKLGPRQRARLEALPGWTWERGELPRRRSPPTRRPGEWREFFRALQGYSVEHGHASPPKRHMTEGNVALGRWVAAQRKSFAEGSLPFERVRLLEQLPGWAWNVTDARWEQNFGDLRRYIDSHDNAYPDREYLSPTGANIDTWIRVQRKAAASGVLSERRRRRLENLSEWSWNRRDLAWEQSFAELAAYVAEHGHANPVQGTITASGMALGHWVSAQRVAFSRGAMAKSFPERIGRLEALPGWVWSVGDALWEDGFAELTAFCEATGSATPAKSVVTRSGHRLGQWAQDQRTKYRRGQLSSERSSRLQRLPGWFWEAPSTDDSWDGYFEALRRFADATGHAGPRAAHVTNEGLRLGAWVSRQRNLYLHGDMSVSHPYRVARLEALPGWEWRRPAGR